MLRILNLILNFGCQLTCQFDISGTVYCICRYFTGLQYLKSLCDFANIKLTSKSKICVNFQYMPDIPLHTQRLQLESTYIGK